MKDKWNDNTVKLVTARRRETVGPYYTLTKRSGKALSYTQLKLFLKQLEVEVKENLTAKEPTMNLLGLQEKRGNETGPKWTKEATESGSRQKEKLPVCSRNRGGAARRVRGQQRKKTRVAEANTREINSRVDSQMLATAVSPYYLSFVSVVVVARAITGSRWQGGRWRGVSLSAAGSGGTWRCLPCRVEGKGTKAAT